MGRAEKLAAPPAAGAAAVVVAETGPVPSDIIGAEKALGQSFDTEFHCEMIGLWNTVLPLIGA